MPPEVRTDRYDTPSGTFVRVYPFENDSFIIWITKRPDTPVSIGPPSFLATELDLARAQAFSTALAAAVKIANELETVEQVRKSES